MEKGDEHGSLVKWYISTMEKYLKIRDEEQKEQIIDQIKPSIIKVSKTAANKRDMVEKLGDPREIARELSDPRNWIVDIGSPITPRKEIKPFFSKKGILILTTLFLIGLAIPIGIFILDPDIGWVLPGLLLSFVALWALGISFLNNFLGYLGTAQDLRDTGMKIDTISYVSLKKYIIVYTGLSTIVSILLGTSSVILDTAVLSISFPITLSTISATLLAARMMFVEGKKVLISQ